MAKERFRIQYKFWLDVTQDDQYDLAETINGLKQARSFSKVVRDGIRLVVDLWHGNLDVLLELFPFVEEAFYQRFVEQRPPETFTIQEQLQHLERLLLEQGNVAIQPRSLVAPDPDNPDDLEPVQLTVTPAASDGQAAQNFLDSAFGLQG